MLKVFLKLTKVNTGTVYARLHNKIKKFLYSKVLRKFSAFKKFNKNAKFKKD